MLTRLNEDIPELAEAVLSSPWINDADRTWDLLREFIDAHSPTGNVTLPGAIGDTLALAVRRAGLAARYHPNFRFTGNPAILLGVKKEQIDLVVDAHLDKPTFGVAAIAKNDPRQASLFACCANRFPPGEYRAPGRALRYDETKRALAVGARGTIVSEREADRRDSLTFEVTEGEVELTDLVTFDVAARRAGAEIVGSGLDDAGGTTIVLATAGVLKEIEPVLEANGLTILFTFSDHEEWPPDSFFSQGASRTTFAVPPPTFGAIVVDVHTAGEGHSIAPGQGISCGFVSSQGKGAIVPLNYQRLTVALATGLNAERPNTVQINGGYFSRSDDWTLMRWTHMLGLLGVPAYNIHLGNETGHLSDVVSGVVFLSHYIPLAMGLSPSAAARFAIGTQFSTDRDRC